MTTQQILDRTEEEKVALATTIVGFLNELLELDPVTMQHLVNHHIECNCNIGEHPTVQTVGIQAAQPRYAVGMLGILNGLVGVKNRVGYICSVHDDDTLKLLRFELVSEESRLKMLDGSLVLKDSDEQA